MKKLIIFVFILSSVCLKVHADGVLLPKDTSYPYTFLKNMVTEITVNIHGQMVETTVYQEFLNESSNPVDAVWNFPMPADARSTKLTYWHNDTAYDAVLRVAEQVVNPGTGDGGIAAVVNQYIGKSGIKLELKNIPAHSTQKICFHYFSLLDYCKGEYTYKYPLNTSDFIQYYLSYLKVNINVDSKSPITSYDFPGYTGYTQVLQSDSNHLSLEMLKNKAYLASDFSFNYNIAQDSLNVDFYSNYSDTLRSYFGLFVKPPLNVIPTKILEKRIIFLIGNSSSMNGYKLQQSVSAVSDALDSLKQNDYFNILFYNSAVTQFNSAFQLVNSTNIQAAKTFLQSATAQNGSDLNTGLTAALNMISDSSYHNCILGFSDGHSVIDPINFANSNHFKTTICFVGLGDNIDRERLEMTAAYNYGAVTYAGANDNIKEKVMEAFIKINAPLIKNVHIDFNKPDVAFVVPTPYPTVNAGSCFYVAGRYSTATQNTLNLYGKGVIGNVGSNYNTSYSADTANEFYVRYLWVKTVMDELERQILIYGEDSVLVDSLIALSLEYKMKCRYTAYFTMQTAITGGGTTGILNHDTITANNENSIKIFPNPFENVMTVSVTIQKGGSNKTKLLKIYSSLGMLVKVIDISELPEGKSTVDIDFSSMPKGIYYVLYQEGNNILKSLKTIHI